MTTANQRVRARRGAALLVCAALLFGVIGAESLAHAAEGKAARLRLESFRLLNEGVAAYKDGRLAEAIEKLSRSASIALSSFRAHYYLGLALAADRRPAAAIDALEIALDLDPIHLQALVALGDARLDQGDVDPARAAYLRALKERIGFPPALDGLARALEAQGRQAEAIRQYRDAIESDPGYVDSYVHLGDLFVRSGRFSEAVELLEEAVSIRPDHAPARNRLAVAYSRLGLFNAAVATIERAIELEPASPDHPATLGEVQLELGLVRRAEASFSRALEIDPRHPGALTGLAEAARRGGDYGQAIAHVDLALSDARLRAAERDDLGAYLEGLVAERERVASLEARMAEGDATIEERRELADIYAARARWGRAAEILADTIRPPVAVTGEAGPSSEPNGGAAERAAYALLRAGRARDALDLYTSLELEGEAAARVALNRGVALTSLGRDADAIRAYRDALTIDDSLEKAKLYIGNALLRLGRAGEAADAYLDWYGRATDGPEAELVRRILEQIAPDRVPARGPAPAASTRPSTDGAPS